MYQGEAVIHHLVWFFVLTLSPISIRVWGVVYLIQGFPEPPADNQILHTFFVSNCCYIIYIQLVMSDNKTVVPGLQGQFPSQAGFNAPVPPIGINPQGQETMIPGVNNAQVSRNAVQSGQVFGFLFSVSKSLAGEYWPLMLGSNTIGRGNGNSINLGELTVSETHASIHVISRANKLIVYIKDDQSKTGTLLNGELLRGEADLKNGDIITIGEHYEMYVVLINPYDLGLKVKEEFQPVNVNNVPSSPATTPFGPNPHINYRPSSGPGTVVEGQTGQIPVGGHTVIMGGNNR